MEKIHIVWVREYFKGWCGLFDAIPHIPDGLEGVYVIFKGDDTERAVRVGQGKIKERVKEHIEDNEVLAFKDNKLYITWSQEPLNKPERDGIERYLGDSLKPYVPLKDQRFPDVKPIEVDIPEWFDDIILDEAFNS